MHNHIPLFMPNQPIHAAAARWTLEGVRMIHMQGKTGTSPAAFVPDITSCLMCLTSAWGDCGRLCVQRLDASNSCQARSGGVTTAKHFQ